jgi:hypothetical protein
LITLRVALLPVRFLASLAAVLLMLLRLRLVMPH